jgi:hypothetical protein
MPGPIRDVSWRRPPFVLGLIFSVAIFRIGARSVLLFVLGDVSELKLNA